MIALASVPASSLSLVSSFIAFLGISARNGFSAVPLSAGDACTYARRWPSVATMVSPSGRINNSAPFSVKRDSSIDMANEVRAWLSASDPLPAVVRQQMRNFGALLRLPGGRRIPPVLLNGYGMVELGGLAMMGIELSFLRSSGGLCFPVPPFQVRIADEHNRRMKAGVTGECQIRRRGLAPHYWKDKDEGSSLLTEDGWLR